MFSWTSLPVATRIAVTAGVFATILLMSAAWGVRVSVHASQMQATEQLAAAQASQITEATRAGVQLSGAFGSLPYELVRSDGAVIASTSDAEIPTVPLPSIESSQMVGETWAVEPSTSFGATLAVSSTLQASSITDIDAADLPGGPIEKNTAAYRAYVFVAPARADEVVASFDPFLWSGVFIMVALIAAASGVAAKRALRPVDRMRIIAASIASTPDGVRVEVPDADDELHALALTLNAMLARIDDATARQRRFVADAAHELRSPLNTLLAAVEIARAHPAALPAERTFIHVETEARRLTDLTEDLLSLAAAGGTELEKEDSCDAVVVVRDIVFARLTNIGLNVTAPADAILAAISERALTGVVRNLLENALRHAATQVEVSLEIDADTHAVVLRIANDGPPIPENDLERIFEPFVRLDTSRSRDTGGTGLGLAIARETLQRAGGTLDVFSTAERTTFSATMRPAHTTDLK